MLQFSQTSIFERQICAYLYGAAFFFRKSTKDTRKTHVSTRCPFEAIKFRALASRARRDIECTSVAPPRWLQVAPARLLTYPASLNRAYTRLAFLSLQERSLRPIFLHEGPLAVAPTIITGWRACAQQTWPPWRASVAACSTASSQPRRLLALLPTVFNHTNLRTAFTFPYAYHLPFLHF